MWLAIFEGHSASILVADGWLDNDFLICRTAANDTLLLYDVFLNLFLFFKSVALWIIGYVFF